ncbi:MAG TPA: flagellar assembly protein FliW [Solirubrobacteraceae bacterium]|nr:flagellar assembly protein FliW [Solirubrobacteraceae bacterium]
MTVIQSTRFGELEIAHQDVLEFPRGLIGLGGQRYTLLDRNPGTGFLWLHCIDFPDLALPVVDPRRFFADYQLQIGEDERELVGAADLDQAAHYVTVRTAPRLADVVVNLRAPILVWEGRGHQVLNTAPGAELQVPLFAPTDPASGVAGEGGPAAAPADAA